MSKYYTDEFKQKIVELRRSGKPTKEIVSEYKITKSSLYMWEKQFVNSGNISNVINRKFNNRAPLEVVVSDLTYVKVAGKYNYICVLLDLSNRQTHRVGSWKIKKCTDC